MHACIFPPIPQYDVSWVDPGPSDVTGNVELEAIAAQLRDEDRQLQGKALLSLQCHDTIVPSRDEWVCEWVCGLVVPNMPPYQPSPLPHLHDYYNDFYMVYSDPSFRCYWNEGRRSRSKRRRRRRGKTGNQAKVARRKLSQACE